MPPVAGRGAWARFMRHGTKGFGFVRDFVSLHYVDCPCPPSCLRRDGVRTCAPDALVTPPLLSRALLLSPPLLPPFFVFFLCLVRFWCCFCCLCLWVLFGCFVPLLLLCPFVAFLFLCIISCFSSWMCYQGLSIRLPS